MPSDKAVIRFDNVGMRYGMGTEVLRDITFQLAPARSISSPVPRVRARPRFCALCSLLSGPRGA